jgi:uncharacterized membrane protein
MDKLRTLIHLLPGFDWLALGAFIAAWLAYAAIASRHGERRPSVLSSSNRVRRLWMLQSTHREVRVLDGLVVQNLSGTASFFASTTIFIIGGLLAVLGTTEQASDLVREIPFAVPTSPLVFDFKVSMLTAIFIYAFFRFTWCIRQYSLGALLVAAAPESKDFGDEHQRNAFADRAGRLMGMAAETFNDGVRAYYMAFAVLAWFISAWFMLAATATVLAVLYWREFHSQVLQVLEEI